MPTDRILTPPDAGSLYRAALDYLSRHAATEAGLRRVLLRRIDRWDRVQTDRDAAEAVVEAARTAVDGVVQRLTKAGAVNDTAFAETRARNLGRDGQSARAIQMRLVAKGVTSELARAAAVMDPEAELASALVLTRKRRIGPYRTAEQVDAAVRLKELALLARAGFSHTIAQQALDTPRDDAERQIFELRR